MKTPALRLLAPALVLLLICAGPARLRAQAIVTYDTGYVGSGTIDVDGSFIHQFISNASAGSATVTVGGELEFYDTATAGSATVTNSGSGSLRFYNAATAGAAIITGDGIVSFANTASAGSAVIVTPASSRPSAWLRRPAAVLQPRPNTDAAASSLAPGRRHSSRVLQNLRARIQVRRRARPARLQPPECRLPLHEGPALSKAQR